MNDQVLEELLDRSAERVTPSAPPVSDLLREGRASRTRQQRLRWATRAVASAAVVSGVALAPHLLHDSGSPTSTPVPAPPAGLKWVGVGDSVVGVPDSWPVIPGIYCSGPTGPYVTIALAHAAPACPRVLDPVAPLPPSVTLLASTSGELDGLHGFAHQGLRNTIVTLPPGWRAVPAGRPAGGIGTPSVTDEITALRSAGFRAVRRTGAPLDRWRAVTTEPEIGSPARIGSTVVVYDRGRIASSSSLSGRLIWTGGPLPGAREPRPGVVHVVSADGSVDQTVQAGSDGRWSIQVPPGTYTVTATSPGFGSVAGGPDACRADRDVTVLPDQSARTDVFCLMR